MTVERGFESNNDRKMILETVRRGINVGAPDKAHETAPSYGSGGVLLTYEDYCRTPDDVRYELIEGELLIMPSPNVYHQEISGRLERMLWYWIEPRGLGRTFHAPLDVVLSEHDVVQPDILYVSRDRLEIIKEANVWGAPDLVAEIISSSTSERDRVKKRRVYALYGVEELWLVDPENKTVEVAFHHEAAFVTMQVYPMGATLVSRTLPGLSIQVDEIFRQRS